MCSKPGIMCAEGGPGRELGEALVNKRERKVLCTWNVWSAATWRCGRWGSCSKSASAFLQPRLWCTVPGAALDIFEGSAATTSCAGSVFHTGATGSRWPLSCWPQKIPYPVQQGPECLSSAPLTVPRGSPRQSPPALEVAMRLEERKKRWKCQAGGPRQALPALKHTSTFPACMGRQRPWETVTSEQKFMNKTNLMLLFLICTHGVEWRELCASH